ncbi:hypothetical protein [Novosphingobium humi]|uniref:Uncharacterized protein n=1 Tax=Novosphingobium humi TaxID=2282397 RepID=A0ABY7U751_9SPHN|nr:hypothetical protein [Novosphingobium humi]WCT80159.1 hypothetical protein PQ457_16335 [Novosphingobium humi]
MAGSSRMPPAIGAKRAAINGGLREGGGAVVYGVALICSSR